MILAFFDLQVTLMLLTKSKVNWLLVQEKKRKIDFQDGRLGGYLRFRIGTILPFFDLQVTPMFPTKFEAVGLFSGEEAEKKKKKKKKKKTIFKMARVAILDI